jgi:hypothetical protein
VADGGTIEVARRGAIRAVVKSSPDVRQGHLVAHARGLPDEPGVLRVRLDDLGADRRRQWLRPHHRHAGDERDPRGDPRRHGLTPQTSSR